MVSPGRSEDGVPGSVRSSPHDPPLPIRPLNLPDPLPTEGPLVSVLIPLYNHERYIGESLGSVLLQTYRSIEVVVVDDCSTDRSLEFARQVAAGDPRVTFHRNPQNLGVVDNQGRLLELSNGPLVKFLAADDRFCMPDALARMVAAMEGEPTIDLVTSQGSWIDGDGNARANQWPPLSPHLDIVIDGIFFGDFSLVQCLNVIGDCQVLYRRKAFDGEEFDVSDWLFLDGHDPGLRALTDIAMSLHVLRTNDAAYLKDPTVQFRIHESGQLSSGESRNPQCIVMWYALMRAARSAGFLADQRVFRKALVDLLVRHMNLDHYQSDAPEDWIWMRDVLQQVAQQIGDLSYQIALGQ